MDNIRADRYQLSVVFEMDYDITNYNRKVYTLIDWFSDIGGLTSSCLVTLKILMLLIKNRDVEWYLVSKLYTAKELLVDISSDSDMHISDEESDSRLAFAKRSVTKKPPKSLGNMHLQRS